MRVFWAFVIEASLAVIVGAANGVGLTPYGEAARISSGAEDSNTLAAVLVAGLALVMGLALVACSASRCSAPWPSAPVRQRRPADYPHGSCWG